MFYIYLFIYISCHIWYLALLGVTSPDRLFQAERPVWHTIHCKALPKKYRETKVEEESKNKQIIMVTDSEDPSTSDSHEWQNCAGRQIFVDINETSRQFSTVLLKLFKLLFFRWERVLSPVQSCFYIFTIRKISFLLRVYFMFSMGRGNHFLCVKLFWFHYRYLGYSLSKNVHFLNNKII